MSRRAATAEQRIVRFAGQVASRIDAVVERLNTVAEAAPVTDPEFGHFRDATRQLLVDGGNDDVLAGSGYAVSYTDRGCPPAMVWWAHRGDSVIERGHSVDPDSESFYDYASLRWFRVAKDVEGPTLSGPFIDTWGSDDYTVTVSLPVSGPTGSLGVVAADVDVRRFIASLIADLRGLSTPLALINESDRVVVSTFPSLSTGLPLYPRGTRDDAECDTLQRFPVSNYGWSVIPLTA